MASPDETQPLLTDQQSLSQTNQSQQHTETNVKVASAGKKKHKKGKGLNRKSKLIQPNFPKMRIVVKSTKTISFDENFEDDESSEHENDQDNQVQEIEEQANESNNTTASAVREPVKAAQFEDKIETARKLNASAFTENESKMQIDVNPDSQLRDFQETYPQHIDQTGYLASSFSHQKKQSNRYMSLVEPGGGPKRELDDDEVKIAKQDEKDIE